MLQEENFIVCSFVLTIVILRRGRLPMSHTTVECTNSVLVSLRDLIFLVFRAVSSLKTKILIIFCIFLWKKNYKILPSDISCLLAKMSIMASFISLSLIIRWSSCRASSSRSLSAQSTTNIKPWVPNF